MHKKIVLPNNLRVIVSPLAGSKTITVLVLVEAGSKYETKGVNGISHFLEHMTFKGTKKRPTPLDIAGPLDRIGGYYNAMTSQEYTGYYAKAASQHLDLVFDVISDIFLNPKFDPQEIDRERGVIIEELNMYLDMPSRHISDLWTKLLYGDQPAGWNVGGEKEIVAKLRPQDFISYHGNHYVADKTLVVVSGDVGVKEALEKVRELFKGISNKNGADKLLTSDLQSAPKSLVEYKKTDQTHIALGLRTYNLFDKRRFVLQVLATILGGGMSSRLFSLLRDKMGVAYYVDTESENLTDSGFLVTQAGIDTKRAGEVVGAILKEYERVKKDKIDEEELSKAKEHLKGSLTLSLESSNDYARFYGFQEILRKEVVEPEEVTKRISEVSSDDIIAVAQDIFRPEKLNLAVIGAYEDPKIFDNILDLK